MIGVRAAIGRFVRHCIAKSVEASAVDKRFAPEFMTSGQISDCLHGRFVDWDKVEQRKRTGVPTHPFAPTRPGVAR